MIYCIGDSFTFGEELPDTNSAWPILLGNLLDRPVVNLGKPATGNYRMVKRTMDSVLSGDAELVVIGWTDPARQEFADDIGITDLWAGREHRRMQSCNDHRINLIKYMTAYDVPGYYYTKWLRQIILVQSFCKANQVRCIMFNACSSEDWHKLYLDKNAQLAKHIDSTDFVGWPYSGSGIWTHGMPKGPNGHFLEEGHVAVANKIFNHIQNESTDTRV